MSNLGGGPHLTKMVGLDAGACLEFHVENIYSYISISILYIQIDIAKKC